jgi:phage-related protein
VADGTLIFDTSLDASGLSTGLGKVGSVAGTAFKGVAVAAGAAATGIGILTKSALDGYAAYEQLTGGVETLFKESSDAVMGYAENAYKTAGMSANQYMETVTSFSASLIQSLGGDTAKAAEVADMTISDMSDNANKMGTSMEMIQNAYNGFAKQNFTMLDNLKLGYGGTQAEMQRLLDDAEKISGIKYDISSFADVAEAIHVVQTEMGITGTTAREAASTIEGSTASMKAAWDNLVVGIADDNADLDLLINQFIDSATTALGNILPRIEIILTGVGQLIEKMVPVIMDQLPGLINGVLPQLINSGISMVNSLIQGIVDNLPALIDLAIDVVMQLVDVLIKNAPKLIEAGLQVIVQLALGIADALPKLIPTLVETIIMIVETLIDNIDMLVDAAIAIIMALAEGLIAALPILIEKIPQIVIKLVEALVANASKLGEAAIQLIIALGKGLIQAIPTLLKNVPQIMEALLKAFTAKLSIFTSVGKGIVEGIWKGISNGYSWIKSKIKGWVGNVVGFFKDILGIHSPSREFEVIGKMCVAGFDEGIEPLLDGSEISRSINASVRTIGANTAYGTNQRIGGFNQTININREISTPDEMARAIRLESKYGLMEGVGFA